MSAVILNGASSPADMAHSLWTEWACLRPLLEHGAADVQVVAATDFVRGAALAEAAAQRCAQADLPLIIAPLYWDSIPDTGLRAREHIHAQRRRSGLRSARLVAVMSCGFAEPEQHRFAFGMLREFAHEAGYAWAGGLPFGGGGAIHGQALQRLLLLAVQLGLQAAYLNQPMQVAALRPKPQQLSGRPRHAQLLVRIGKAGAFVECLKTRMEAGEFRALVDREYPLEAIADAYRYVETVQKIGIVVINVRPESENAQATSTAGCPDDSVSPRARRWRSTTRPPAAMLATTATARRQAAAAFR